MWYEKNKFILSKPKFIVSSKLPAWTNGLPVISQSFLNLQSLDKINLINKNSFYVDTNKVNKISHELDYESLTEDSIRIKMAVRCYIRNKLDFAKSVYTDLVMKSCLYKIESV